MTRSPDPQLAREWRARLDRFDQSEFSVAKFCQLEGYSTASFYQWRRKLKDPPAAPTPAFLPVVLADDLIDPPVQAALRIELPGGAIINLPANAGIELQRDLITAIVQATSDEVSA